MINGKKYLLCSQWFKQFRSKLDAWIKLQAHDSGKPIKEGKKRTKERCSHYDLKKNQCMCTGSKVFTLQCENVMACENYLETYFPIYIVPKHVNKSKKCPFCNSNTEKEFVVCTYKTADKKVENNLLTYRCTICEKNYIADSLYISYTKSKNISDLDVDFKRIM